MIISINCTNEHGIPRSVELNPPSPVVTFITKTNEQIEGFLGNAGRTDVLPQSFSVNKKALVKQPWCFGKTLYLTAQSFMAESLDGNQYHHPVNIDDTMMIRGLVLEDNVYGYIVVEPATDPRYRWWPVLVHLTRH